MSRLLQKNAKAPPLSAAADEGVSWKKLVKIRSEEDGCFLFLDTDTLRKSKREAYFLFLLPDVPRR